MSFRQVIQQSLEDLGPVMSLRGVYQHNENAWSLYVVDHLEILVDFDEEMELVVLSCDLVPREDANLLSVFNALMAFNTLWLQSGHFQFGLVCATHKIELAQTLAVSRLNLATLSQALTKFQRTAEFWQEKLEEPELWSGESVAIDQASLIDCSTMLKV